MRSAKLMSNHAALPIIDSSFRSLFSTHLIPFDPELRDEVSGLTPLNQAALENQTEKLLELIREGADVNTRDNNGYTPLHNAIRAGNKLIASLLLQESSVDVNIPSIKRKTILEFAFDQGYFEGVEQIINHPSFDPNYYQIIARESESEGFYEYFNAKNFDTNPLILETFEQARLFGFQFDFKGCFKLDGLTDHQFNCFRFEASSRKRGVERFFDDFNFYFESIVNQVVMPDWAFSAFNNVLLALKFAMTDFEPLHYYEKIAQGDLVYMPSGWFKHAVDFVFYQDTFYRCNRGKHSDGIHGIEIFQITKMDNLDLALVHKLMKEEFQPEFIQSHLVDILGLVKIGDVVNPKQVAGNCRWTSMEAGLEASLIAAFVNEGLPFNDAQALAKGNFNTWETFDLDRKFKDVLDHKDTLLEQGIYDDLLVKTLTYHHNPLDENNLKRGIHIFHELVEPSVFDAFDALFGQLILQYAPNALHEIGYLAPYRSMHPQQSMMILTKKETNLADKLVQFMKACQDYEHKNQFSSDSLQMEDIFNSAILSLENLFLVFDNEFAVRSDDNNSVYTTVALHNPLEIFQYTAAIEI